MTAHPVTLVRPQSILGVAHGVVKTILSPVTSGAGALAGVALSAIVSWVLGAARAALLQTAHMIGMTTAPQLTSAWFSATYWQVAGLAALITIPFLCAAAIQAVLRSDLALLAQSALVHLPIALLAVNLAAPIVMLLLSATDQMCGAVAQVGSTGGAAFLASAARDAGALSAIDGSPFFAVVVGLLTATVAIALMVELLVREAAVYVVVLMLPLVFAGLVWPARRIWAVRLSELLVGLILSKFVIVAVLSLAGTALGGTGGSAGSRLLTAMALLLLSTFAPWAMLRLLPFTELAAGVSDALSNHARRLGSPASLAGGAADEALDLALAVPALLGRDAGRAERATSLGGDLGVFSSSVAGGGGSGSGSAATRNSDDGNPKTAAGSAAGSAGTDLADLASTGPGGIGPVATDGAPGRTGDLDSDPPETPRRGAPIWRAADNEWPPFQLDAGGWAGPTTYRGDAADPKNVPGTDSIDPYAIARTGDAPGPDRNVDFSATRDPESEGVVDPESTEAADSASVETSGTGPVQTPDSGFAPAPDTQEPDAGAPDARTPDAQTPDAQTPDDEDRPL
jgi:hypothetical protein